MLKFHKEGKKIIAITGFTLLFINALIYILFFVSATFSFIVSVASLLFFIFILRFFRKPKREFIPDDNKIFSPADGKVIAIEEVFESEYFKDKRVLVSVFMSVWNIHINWYPIKGIIQFLKYHPGKYLLARHPKSSELNERTSIVLKNDKGEEILVRQIAGIVARRVVYYPVPGQTVNAGEEMGFIKFGSRLDVYLPLSAKVLVKPGDKVKGKITHLAEW